MKKNHPIIKGTLILTATGITSRLIGFYYRIFLAQTIGAEGMGIYQLIFPVYAICLALTTHGLETAISKLVSEELVRGNQKRAREIMYKGLSISVSSSVILAFLLHRNASFVAVSLLKEARCAPLLQMLAFALPFASCHSCIMGFYFGSKKTGVPAASQMLEQIVRVGSVYVLSLIYAQKSMTITPAVAVLGLAFGEFLSALFSLTMITGLTGLKDRNPAKALKGCVHRLLSLSIPLTFNRVVLNLLSSIEAVLIPGCLKIYGLDTSSALSVYGILTGMAMPLILFPNALTGSAAVMLLPVISEAQSQQDRKQIYETVRHTIVCCLALGGACMVFFLIFGHFLGDFLFKNELAGNFIMTFAWICPFLYLNTTLGSILHGLGLTGTAFINNIIGLTIRICFIVMLVPRFGIIGYMLGLLCNQLTVTLLALLALRPHLELPLSHNA